ncbi:hypothetical protein [Desulfotruncus alcoholivorax]|uniref:hypothetical protein n=1 Tax=Desulfotruncus alcoholivorax TaxID=265477 RepID=UPI0003FF40D6|nr:hypothetical protein [Desulfotruncus alcoholivorax]
MENSSASKTPGRTFGYLLMSGQPGTMDEIAKDLLYSKATASLIISDIKVQYERWTKGEIDESSEKP